MEFDKWQELKAHAKRQYEQAEKNKTNAGRIIAHVWRDVLNKMWSLEKNETKKRT